MNAVFVPCGDMFCFKCIRTWSNKNKNCPICRKNFRIQDAIPNKVVDHTIEMLLQQPNSYTTKEEWKQRLETGNQDRKSAKKTIKIVRGSSARRRVTEEFNETEIIPSTYERNEAPNVSASNTDNTNTIEPTISIPPRSFPSPTTPLGVVQSPQQRDFLHYSPNEFDTTRYSEASTIHGDSLFTAQESSHNEIENRRRVKVVRPAYLNTSTSSSATVSATSSSSIQHGSVFNSQFTASPNTLADWTPSAPFTFVSDSPVLFQIGRSPPSERNQRKYFRRRTII